MYSSVLTSIHYGIEAVPVRVEADVSEGLPQFEMVGYLGSEVKEARERVSAALRNSGCRLPAKKITVNLTPADIRKYGNSCDFPVAAALLISFGYIEAAPLQNTLLLGEVGLDGRLLPARGVLSAAILAYQSGCRRIIVPKENAGEAAIFPDLPVIGVTSVRHFIDLCNQNFPKKAFYTAAQRQDAPDEPQVDFSDIHGQAMMRRAAEIAAAGMHHLLIIGPPGSGKTMAAMRIPTILPEMTQEEKLEVSRIYSLCGLLDEERILCNLRPFRAPHHTVTTQAMTGGGKMPHPGELSLAHRGVLFLDELPEFSRQTLEVLREPLEEKVIHVSRVSGTFVYPADFLLVAAMNPCHCGYYPDLNRCRCSPSSIRRYIDRISQPLLDRFDLAVETQEIRFKDLADKKPAESSAQMQKRVTEAKKSQRERFANENFSSNSAIPSGKIIPLCRFRPECLAAAGELYEDYRLSARSYHKLLRVARTIADLDGAEDVELSHLREAVLYRSVDKKYWRIEE